MIRLVAEKEKVKKESTFARESVPSKNTARRNFMLCLSIHTLSHRDKSRLAVKPIPRFSTESTIFWIWLLPDTVTTLSSSSPIYTSRTTSARTQICTSSNDSTTRCNRSVFTLLSCPLPFTHCSDCSRKHNKPFQYTPSKPRVVVRSYSMSSSIVCAGWLPSMFSARTRRPSYVYSVKLSKRGP